jgi:sugar phosphate isomerase/epimerase
VIEHAQAFTQSEVVSSEPQLINRPKSPPILRTAVNHLMTFDWNLDDELVAWPKEGLRAIGLWRPKLDHFGEERFAELCRELGISVSSLSWAGGFTGTNRWSFDDSVEDARSAIRAAATVGAECLCVVSGPRGGHIASHARRLVNLALKELAPEAADAGVTLALQPMRSEFSRKWTFLSTIDETLEIVAPFGDAVKIAFDVHHLSGEPQLLTRIPGLARHVALVQLSDAGSRPTGNRRLPGDGEVPLAAIVRAFDEAGYTGYYELATWSGQLWQRDCGELLRESRARLDSLCRRPVSAALERN